MAFDALDTAVRLVAALREPLGRVQQHDRDLASQARRAASSVALNLGEGQRRGGRDRLQHFRIAAGSAAEVGVALRVAVEWGFLDGAGLAEARGLLDRVLAMTWRLTHPVR
ncbi:MAG: four helix bundle protein [Deltaproteobacteria bacterium]|nr:four helix bundle protein [Deltaproteobacteria bacterium]